MLVCPTAIVKGSLVGDGNAAKAAAAAVVVVVAPVVSPGDVTAALPQESEDPNGSGVEEAEARMPFAATNGSEKAFI